MRIAVEVGLVDQMKRSPKAPETDNKVIPAVSLALKKRRNRNSIVVKQINIKATHGRRTEERVLVVRCLFYIPGEMANGGDV